VAVEFAYISFILTVTKQLVMKDVFMFVFASKTPMPVLIYGDGDEIRVGHDLSPEAIQAFEPFERLEPSPLCVKTTHGSFNVTGPSLVAITKPFTTCDMLLLGEMSPLRASRVKIQDASLSLEHLAYTTFTRGLIYYGRTCIGASLPPFSAAFKP
jgi:hypothetical protein